jgi:protoheme IX farnesyltransferase
MAVVMLTSGSAMLNAVQERNDDARLLRCAKRNAALKDSIAIPCVSGVILVASGTLLAAIYLSPLATLLLATAVGLYLVPYTWLKKRGAWGTPVGAVATALPILAGSVALNNFITPGALALFFFLAIWQIPHTWLFYLAHLDDYREARLPVLPVLIHEQRAGHFTIVALALLVIISPLPSLFAAMPLPAAASSLLISLLLLAITPSLLAARRHLLLFRLTLIHLALILTLLAIGGTQTG